jgi:hypothetical protein
MKKATRSEEQGSQSQAQHITSASPAQLLRTALSKIAQVLPSVARCTNRAYSSPVAAKSATGFGDSINVRRTSANQSKAGAFFVSVTSFYGGCARETFGSAGCLTSRFANLRTAATHNRLATIRGSSSTLGAPLMQSIRNLRAAAHRRMAFAALHADSSLKTRLTRYQHHINQARALEAVGGAV